MPKATVVPSLPPSPMPRHSGPRSGGTATADPPTARPDVPTDTDQPSLCNSLSVGPNSQPVGHSAAARPTGAATRPTVTTVVAAASERGLVAKSARDIGVEVRGAGPIGHGFEVKSAHGGWPERATLPRVDSTDLAFAGAAEQARLLAAGATTAPALLDLYLDRIARLDPKVRSYRVVLADSARSEAAAAQARLEAGERRPLLGVPIAIKDDVDVAGEVTTYGTGAYGPAKTTDAEVVRRLRAAGAVILG